MKKPMQPMVDTMTRPKFDTLYTPVEAVIPLLPYIPPRSFVWECTDRGGSNITRVLREAYHNVTTSDIVSGRDFLAGGEPPIGTDIIVTNPPYSLKDQFIERCYAYGMPFALLLPITALNGVGRGNMYREHGISIVVLDRRPDFTGKGRNWFSVGWFCWNLPPLGNNRIVFEQMEKQQEETRL